MERPLAFAVLLLLPLGAIARGGRGSSTDGAMLLALASLFAVVAIGTYLRKRYPTLPQLLGGLFVFLMIGNIAALALAATGIISSSAIPLTGLLIAVAAPFALTWLTGKNKS